MLKPFIIILALVGIAYRLLLSVVQLRSAKNPIPENVRDVYDKETYLRWREYSRETNRLSLISASVSSAISLILLTANLYAAFASLFSSDVFMQLFAVILLDTGISAVVDTVFAYIRTMRIEEKYGFNRSTAKTFVIDRIRAIIFEFILYIALVELLCILHQWMQDAMILLFAGVIFLVSLAISFLYPVFSRMANKFVPLEDGELKTRLLSLLESHGYKVKAIEVMDASRRTTKLNAYFTGFGKMKTIVLYDNLVNTMTPDEICAVFAHELGHGLHKDVLKMQIMNIGNLLLLATAVWLAVRDPALHTAFGFSEVNYGFAYILAGAFIGLIQPFTSMLMNAYSRHAEFRADRQAVKEGYGDAMVDALKKLARENFAHLSPSRINVVLEYSHPPLHARIEAVEKAKKQ